MFRSKRNGRDSLGEEIRNWCFQRDKKGILVYVIYMCKRKEVGTAQELEDHSGGVTVYPLYIRRIAGTVRSLETSKPTRIPLVFFGIGILTMLKDHFLADTQ